MNMLAAVFRTTFVAICIVGLCILLGLATADVAVRYSRRIPRRTLVLFE